MWAISDYMLAKERLFDHLVGALLKGEWDLDAERLRGLEVQDHLELSRKLHRRSPGFSPRRMRST
jgi:hypothetical protein